MNEPWKLEAKPIEDGFLIHFGDADLAAVLRENSASSVIELDGRSLSIDAALSAMIAADAAVLVMMNRTTGYAVLTGTLTAGQMRQKLLQTASEAG